MSMGKERILIAAPGFCSYTCVMKIVLRLLRWLPAAFIIGCSWYLSSQPKIEHMPQFPNADKLVHGVCFAGLAFWMAFGVGAQAFTRLHRGGTAARLAAPAALTSLYAVIDEIHQSFTPGRTCDAADWCADTVGAVVGSVVFLLACRWLTTLRARDNKKRF